MTVDLHLDYGGHDADAQKGKEQHLCLARGSLVLTRGGYKPIDQVVVGEHVLTHRGRWRPVLAVQNTGVRSVVDHSVQQHRDVVPAARAASILKDQP